jgi:hypothetical protein
MPAYLTDEAKFFIMQLLQLDPNDRLGVGKFGSKEIKEHPFFEVSYFCTSGLIIPGAVKQSPGRLTLLKLFL